MSMLHWLRTRLDPVRRHVAEAVSAGTFTDDPFPCLVWRNALPASLYDRLDASWPSFALMQHAPADTVASLYFTADGFGKDSGLQPGQIAAWLRFRDLVRETVFPVAFERFRPGLAALGRMLLSPDGEPQPHVSPLETARPDDLEPTREFLVTRRDLSVLGPHVDPLRLHLTLLIYFGTEVRPGLGTILYRQTGPGRAFMPSEQERCSIEAQYTAQQDIASEEAVRFDFVPNSGLMFLNGPKSWHGQHLSEPMNRRNFNANWQLPAHLVRRAFRPVDADALLQDAAKWEPVLRKHYFPNQA
jgi:hypothetical protein